jgi:hypothetical protein
MLHQIEILNRCLRDLQDSELAKPEKLKQEALLLQLKRLLLVPEVAAMVKGDAGSENEFTQICDALQQANRPGRWPR